MDTEHLMNFVMAHRVVSCDYDTAQWIWSDLQSRSSDVILVINEYEYSSMSRLLPFLRRLKLILIVVDGGDLKYGVYVRAYLLGFVLVYRYGFLEFSSHWCVRLSVKALSASGASQKP